MLPSQSAVIAESVSIRKRAAHGFPAYYKQLCSLQNTVPLPLVLEHIDNNILDLNVDNIGLEDWKPIVIALSVNKSLKFVGIRSYYQLASLKRDHVSTSPPVIYHTNLLSTIIKGIGEMLVRNRSITHLEIQNIHMSHADVRCLAKCISKNDSLQHVSLEYSSVGDVGVEVLCRALRKCPNIISLNLTSCGVTSTGVKYLAALIRYENGERYSMAWAESLRYRKPRCHQHGGLRRLTLNRNPMVDDLAAMALIDVLLNDLWLKALDLQRCGLTNTGLHRLLELVKYNSSLEVVDVRENYLGDPDLIRAVVEQCLLNTKGQNVSYHWLHLPPPTSRVHTHRRQNSWPPSGASGIGEVKYVSTRSRGKCPPFHRPGLSSLYDGQQETTHAPAYAPASLTPSTSHQSSSVTPSLSPIPGVRASAAPTPHIMSPSLKHLEEKLELESKDRKRLNEEIVKLKLENAKLRRMLKKCQSVEKSSVLLDGGVLETIEEAFDKFHQFLDRLRNSGYSQLAVEADEVQQALPTTIRASGRRGGETKLDGETDLRKLIREAVENVLKEQQQQPQQHTLVEVENTLEVPQHSAAKSEAVAKNIGSKHYEETGEMGKKLEMVNSDRDKTESDQGRHFKPVSDMVWGDDRKGDSVVGSDDKKGDGVVGDDDRKGDSVVGDDDIDDDISVASSLSAVGAIEYFAKKRESEKQKQEQQQQKQQQQQTTFVSPTKPFRSEVSEIQLLQEIDDDEF